MSKRGLLVVVAVLAACAAWAVYAQGKEPSAAGTPRATEQCVGCTTHSGEPASCCGDCTACPGCADKDCDGLCATAGTCAKHTNAGCGGHQGCGRRGSANSPQRPSSKN